ncbi:MAG: hypothetical protein HYU63_08920 [Armatimonadetes bacterium]|nr:hypothetical protein [Armatimonadota bacterium]
MDNDKIRKIGESKEAITATAAQYAQYLANLQKESEIEKVKKEEGEDALRIKDKVHLQSLKKAKEEKDWTTPPDLQHFPPKEASGGIELNPRPYNKRGAPTVGIPADSGKVGPNPSFNYPEPKIRIELPETNSSESAIKEKIENLKRQIKGEK